MREGKSARKWLMLFPLWGIDVTDKEPGLDALPFGDATLIAQQAIPALLADLRPSLAKQARADPAIVMVRNATQQQPFHGYLGLFRQAAWPAGPRRPRFIEEAYERAREHASLLALAVLEKRGRTGGPFEWVRIRPQGVSILDMQDGDLHTVGKGCASLALDDCQVERSPRAQFRALTEQGAFSGLAQIVWKQSRRSDLDKRVVPAAVSIARAALEADPSAQVLHSVTAMEMLLLREGGVDKYSRLESRLEALLGAPFCKEVDVPKLLSSRHDYVHRSKAPDPLLSHRGIYVACACLLKCVEFTPLLTAPDALIAYLDAVDAQVKFERLIRQPAFAAWQARAPKAGVPALPVLRQIVARMPP